MQRKHLTAVFAVLLTMVLYGCGYVSGKPLYTDIVVNYEEKYNIDLSREGVFGDDGALRIIEAGRYRILGQASEGRIVVEAPPRAEVEIIFDGASLSSNDGIALHIRRAGEVKLVIKDGTRNSLSIPTRDGERTPALCSEVPLIVEGSGSLQISSESGDGVRVKGETTLLGSNIDIISYGDGIYTEGVLKLSGATLAINAEGDGIRADGEEAALLIENGTNTVNAANTALSSAGSTVITGGSIISESCKVGIESADIHLDGGKLDIAASEMGIRTLGTLSMNGSKLNISSEQDGIVILGDESALVVESGTSVIKANGGIGIKSTNVDLLGGTLTITAAKSGIYSDGTIKQGGSDLTITSDGDGIVGFSSMSALIFESGSNLIESRKAGVRADGVMSVVGGKITARKCAIGLSATDMSLTGGKVTITAREDGIYADNTINFAGTTVSVKSDWDGIKTGSKESVLTVEKGTHTINARNKAITSAGTVSVVGGDITAEANSIGIIASEISLTGGKIRLVTQDDGVYTDGKIKLDGTNLTVKAQGDGIRADGNNASLVLESGKYVISALTNALCSTDSLTVLGGEISVEESAIGISSPKIRIKDGKFEVYSSELAFDSKENVLIEGGNVLVSVFSKDPEKTCSVNTKDAKIEHTGGEFISFSNDYANFSDRTTICSVSVGFSDPFTAGEISIATETGDTVYKLKEKHQVQYISVSSPKLKKDEIYKFTAGDATTRVKLQQQIVRQKVSSEPASFKDFSFTASNGFTLKYYLYTPAYANDNMPLVVFLHGSAESGSNLASLTNPPCLPKYLKEGTLTPDCYVIMPQSSITSWTSERIQIAVEELIEESRNTLSKESGLVSLTGFSMGGGGVWGLALRHPERYNKVAPLSGWIMPTQEKVKKVLDLPIWDFVGLSDTAVSYNGSRNMTTAIKAAGGKVIYTTDLPGANHQHVSGLAYLNKHTMNGEEVYLLDWLTTPRE